jgi:lysyl-tRNA synthetase, class II
LPEHPVNRLEQARYEKGQALAALGQGPYALRFEPSHRTAALQQEHADLPNGEERPVAVAVAGRVMTRRVMGKLAFFSCSSRRPTCWRRCPSSPRPSPRSPRWWMPAI